VQNAPSTEEASNDGVKLSKLFLQNQFLFQLRKDLIFFQQIFDFFFLLIGKAGTRMDMCIFCIGNNKGSLLFKQTAHAAYTQMQTQLYFFKKDQLAALFFGDKQGGPCATYVQQFFQCINLCLPSFFQGISAGAALPYV